MIDGGTFEKNYKDVLSDFRSWSQRDHASDWVLLPENMSIHLGLDETSFCHEVYTIFHNKEGHGGSKWHHQFTKGHIQEQEPYKRLSLDRTSTNGTTRLQNPH